jgi:AcrR family transcriptional regulator
MAGDRAAAARLTPRGTIRGVSPRRAAVLRDAGDGQSLREHLIATAERMISSRGTAALTVRQIAREAGVADGVLYNYFDGKEDLLANAVAAHVRTIEAGLGDLPRPGEGDLGENLRTHVRYGLALHRALLPLMAGLGPESEVVSRFTGLVRPDTSWRDKLLRYLNAERDLGRLAPGAPVEAATTMIVGVCHEMVLTLLLPAGADAGIFAAPPDAGDVVAVILDGIRARRDGETR